MGRRYFDMSGAWSRHEARMRQTGEEFSDDSRPAIVSTPGRTPFVHTQGIGLDSSEVRFGDDPAVKIGEHIDREGNVVAQYQRYDQNGTSRGTYEATWVRDEHGRQILRGSRRVYGG